MNMDRYSIVLKYQSLQDMVYTNDIEPPRIIDKYGTLMQ